jgi:hypothetical protein
VEALGIEAADENTPNPLENKPDREQSPIVESSPLALTRDTSGSVGHGKVTALDDLKAALTDAIRARAWRAVEIIQGQIDDRAIAGNVIPLQRRGLR